MLSSTELRKLNKKLDLHTVYSDNVAELCWFENEISDRVNDDDNEAATLLEEYWNAKRDASDTWETCEELGREAEDAERRGESAEYWDDVTDAAYDDYLRAARLCDRIHDQIENLAYTREQSEDWPGFHLELCCNSSSY